MKTFRVSLISLLCAMSCAAVQYSGGTYVDTTITQITGTRGELVQMLSPHFVTAGWTVTTGSGTDITVRSATTPAGHRTALRMFDPGSGNCAQFVMADPDGAGNSRTFYLLPAVGKTFRVIVTRYQFFVHTSAIAQSRDMIAGGVLYVPPGITSTSNVWWMYGSGKHDADGEWRQTTLRNSIGLFANNGNYYSPSSTLFNATRLDQSDVNGAPCFFRLDAGSISNLSNSVTAIDDSFMLTEAYFGWGHPTTANNPKIVGQLWDAVMIHDNTLGVDTTFSFDGHTYRVMGVGNGSPAQTTKNGAWAMRISN